MLLHYMFFLGICVEAVTGAIAASRKKMDFFGILFIAIITALGGGTIRDLLTNNYPLLWVAHPELILITATCGIATIIFFKRFIRMLKVFLILDALGLATFTVIGAQKAINLSLPVIIVIMSAMVTGICGGMLRDILCNTIPLVLRKELYALIAMVGAIIYVILEHFHIPQILILFITISMIFTTRVLAITYHIEMPTLDYSESS